MLHREISTFSKGSRRIWEGFKNIYIYMIACRTGLSLTLAAQLRCRVRRLLVDTMLHAREITVFVRNVLVAHDKISP